jgi:4-hydroxy-3-methylbut-2-enyl diphosphate reductase
VNDRRIIVANPHGFCEGVRRAIEIVDRVLRVCAGPVYCLKELVHNRQVVDDLSRRGVRFVRTIEEIEPGAVVLFSAHGVSPAIRAAAAARRLHVVDATCPFVSKVHQEVKRYAAQGYTVLLVGHPGHDEIVGVQGEAPDHIRVLADEAQARTVEAPDPAKVAVVTQTTLSLAEVARTFEVLRSRFPAMQTPPKGDVCFATENRQRAVKALAGLADAVIVLGSENSSNSRRLVEVAREAGLGAHLVSTESQLDSIPLAAVHALGLTAGASTPASFVDGAIARLRARGFDRVEPMEAAGEDIRLGLGRKLLDTIRLCGECRRQADGGTA